MKKSNTTEPRHDSVIKMKRRGTVRTIAASSQGGVRGRRTGISVKRHVLKDLDGLENVDDFFFQDEPLVDNVSIAGISAILHEGSPSPPRITDKENHPNKLCKTPSKQPHIQSVSKACSSLQEITAHSKGNELASSHKKSRELAKDPFSTRDKISRTPAKKNEKPLQQPPHTPQIEVIPKPPNATPQKQDLIPNRKPSSLLDEDPPPLPPISPKTPKTHAKNQNPSLPPASKMPDSQLYFQSPEIGEQLEEQVVERPNPTDNGSSPSPNKCKLSSTPDVPNETEGDGEGAKSPKRSRKRRAAVTLKRKTSADRPTAKRAKKGTTKKRSSPPPEPKHISIQNFETSELMSADGVRRGGRHRIPPLNWWKNEKVVYQRRGSAIHLPHIVEIIKTD